MVAVKLLSLTLGLTMAGFLVTYVVFLSSFDSFMPDSDRLYSLRVRYDIANKESKLTNKIMAPVVPKILETVAAVETGTRFWSEGNEELKIDEKAYGANIVRADSLFFKTMGYKVLRGIPSEVMVANSNVFVSQTLAQNMFGGSDPIGQNFKIANQTYIIRGIFEDIPQNSTYKFDLVLPLVNPRTKFDGGDSWFSYLKLPSNADTATIISDINRAMTPYNENFESFGYKLTYYFKPIEEENYDDEKDTILILSIMSIVLILVSGLNYVLLSLSSLASRAKEIGVHKVSGGGKATIFGIIIWETVIYILLSSVISGFLLWALKSEFENITQSDLWSVFSMSNYWAVGVVMLAILLIAGVFPAWVFSRIPLSEVFRKTTNLRSTWKKVLLFFQFASSAFVLCFLVVIIKQHKDLTTADLGYDYEKLAVIEMSGVNADFELLANKLRQESFVEGITFSANLPIESLSGAMFRNQDDTTGNSISVRYLIVDSAFVSVYGVKMAQGSGDLRVDGNLVVNQELVSTFGGTLNPLGMTMVCTEMSGDVPIRVSGVMQNFVIQSFRVRNQPVVFWVFNLDQIEDRHPRKITLRLNEVTKNNVETILSIAQNIFPNEKIEVKSYQQIIDERYSSEESFRDGIMLAAIILLLITILGVVGYVATEIKRKSKEIAIRRVHGATSWSVIFVIMTPLLIIAIISVFVGMVATGFLSNIWLEQFAYQTELVWWIFVGTGCFIMGSLVITVIVQSAKIATENPSINIKKE